MALMKSSNPALQEKTFQGTILEGLSTEEAMSVKGTMNKFGVLMMLMLASTLFAWTQFYKGGNPEPFMIAGGLGGFVVALIMAFNKKIAHILGPIYAILLG